MTQTEFLLDELEYYTTDTNRRCVDGGACTYSPAKVSKVGISQGCAIGRHLTPELQEELDERGGYSGVSNPDIFPRLPDNLKELGQNFLYNCQSLHDCDDYWEENSLNEAGKEAVNHIITTHNLDESLFKKYLS
jgi:hypothetical protein